MFGSVKYFVSGEVPNTVHKILHENGAEQVQYFSDYVTHCIVGQDAAENDICEAKDLYEIPVVTVEWVLQSMKCSKILPTGGFMVGDDGIFSGVVACLSRLSQRDRKRLWAMVTYNGGKLDRTLHSSCTHLIVAESSGAKYSHALKCNGVKVVSPDWILDSLRAGKRCDEMLYHPRYLNPATCFSADIENSNEFQPDSETRVLLEKLKMCLPWNKPKCSISTGGSLLASDEKLLSQVHEVQNTTDPSAVLLTNFESQCKILHDSSVPDAKSSLNQNRERDVVVDCNVQSILSNVFLFSEGSTVELKKRRWKLQLDKKPVNYVPLLASHTPGVGEKSVDSGGSLRQMSSGRFQQTASIAARRFAAFNKGSSSTSGQNLEMSQLCLKGSIFHIIGYQEISSKCPTWTQIITKYGGTVESSYGPSVTHVLCANLKEHTAQQAVEEGKFCVTAYWLNDVLQEKKMIPPWLAIHLPVAFSEEKPCKDLRISISQFENEERTRVQLTIEKLGAIFTQSFSKENDLLICKRASGYKYTKACEWGIPAVNTQWVNDVYLSNPVCIPDPKQSKYQNFDIENSCRPHLDSILMAAWEENVDKHSDNDGVVISKAKRLHEEDMCLQPQLKKLKNGPVRHLQLTKIKVAFSLTKEKGHLQKKVIELGGEAVSNIKEATHLIMCTKNLSTKFFCALSLVRFIVSDKWLEDSYVAKRFLDERSYILDINWKENPKLSLHSLLKKPNRTLLFKDKIFLVTPNVTPKRNIIKEIIEAAGGTIETQLRTVENLQEARLDTLNYFIISGSSDRDSVSYLSDHGYAVLHPSALMISILKQEVIKA